MITSRSRYINNPVVLLDTERGPVVTIAPLTPTPKQIQFTSIRLQAGDRLDIMAKHLFGDETQWWRIADANPEILDWTDLPAGTILRVPSAQ